MNNIYGFGLDDYGSSTIIPDPLVINELDTNILKFKSITNMDSNSSYVKIFKNNISVPINTNLLCTGFSTLGGLSGYDSGTGSFLVTIDGFYMIVFNVYNTNINSGTSADRFSLIVNKVGSGIMGQNMYIPPNSSVPTSQYGNMSFTWMGILNLSDVVELGYKYSTDPNVSTSVCTCNMDITIFKLWNI